MKPWHQEILLFSVDEQDLSVKGCRMCWREIIKESLYLGDFIIKKATLLLLHKLSESLLLREKCQIKSLESGNDPNVII